MNKEWHPRNSKEVLEEDRMRAVERDFFDYWGEQLIAVGWDRDYIEDNMKHYHNTAQKIIDRPDLWPAGVADYQRIFLRLVVKPAMKGPKHE